MRGSASWCRVHHRPRPAGAGHAALDRARRGRPRVGCRGRRHQRQHGRGAGRGVDRRAGARSATRPIARAARAVGGHRTVDGGLPVLAGRRRRVGGGDGHPHARGRPAPRAGPAAGGARRLPRVGGRGHARRVRRSGRRCGSAAGGGDSARRRVVPRAVRSPHGGGGARVRWSADPGPYLDSFFIFGRAEQSLGERA